MSDNVKDQIKSAAIKLFASEGFAGTSVREIATAAGVNVAAINYHFGSKEGLLSSLFLQFAKGKIDAVAELLEPARSLEEFRIRLKVFVEQFIAMAIQNPEQAEMVHKNMDLFLDKCPDAFSDSFQKMHERLRNFFSHAQENSLIRQDGEIPILVQIFMSSLSDIVRNRRICRAFMGLSIEDQDFRTRYAELFIDCYINGVKNNGQDDEAT